MTTAPDRESPVAGRRIVLGVTGGIAAYKACSLLRRFTEAGADVTVVPTESALHFVGSATWEALSGKPVATGVWDRVDEVRHVRVGQEADLVVVAPATADLVARAAHGLANDLLTNVLLTARCPVVLSPAMHTEMWQHPATVANVALLRERGVHVVEPASGRLTGADTGPGRLPEPEDIHAECLAVLAAHDRASGPDGTGTGTDSDSDTATRHEAAEGSVLRGRRVVVSAGGTREPLDPVRFLGNRSSGKQGYALAAEAAARGAHVTLVSSASLPTPEGVHLVEIETARELAEAMTTAAAEADVVVMAAAVADFRPAAYVESKIKKRQAAHGEPEPEDAPVIELVRNPDILAGLVRARDARRAEGVTGPLIVGFAAETGDDEGDMLHHARAKLARKGCDLLVANEVGVGVVFGQDDTTVHVLRRGGDVLTSAGPTTKAAASAAVWDAVEEALSGADGAFVDSSID